MTYFQQALLAFLFMVATTLPCASFRVRPLLKLSAELSSLYCLRPLESLMSKSSPAGGEKGSQAKQGMSEDAPQRPGQYGAFVASRLHKVRCRCVHQRISTAALQQAAAGHSNLMSEHKEIHTGRQDAAAAHQYHGCSRRARHCRLADPRTDCTVPESQTGGSGRQGQRDDCSPERDIMLSLMRRICSCWDTGPRMEAMLAAPCMPPCVHPL